MVDKDLIFFFCVAQVETVAQFGVIFLLFALGLEFSAAKVCTFSPSYVCMVSLFRPIETLRELLYFVVAASCSSCSSYSRRSPSDIFVHVLEWDNSLGMF